MIIRASSPVYSTQGQVPRCVFFRGCDAITEGPHLIKCVGKLHMLIERSYHDISDCARHELTPQPISPADARELAQYSMRHFGWNQAGVGFTLQTSLLIENDCSQIWLSFVYLRSVSRNPDDSGCLRKFGKSQSLAPARLEPSQRTLWSRSRRLMLYASSNGATWLEGHGEYILEGHWPHVSCDLNEI